MDGMHWLIVLYENEKIISSAIIEVHLNICLK